VWGDSAGLGTLRHHGVIHIEIVTYPIANSAEAVMAVRTLSVKCCRGGRRLSTRSDKTRARFSKWFSALGLALLVVILMQPRILVRDQRLLLTLNGEPFDVVGSVTESWGRLLSNCSSVKWIDNESGVARAVLRVIQQHSPPDSFSAKIVRIDMLHDWLLVEATLETLPPVLVLMRASRDESLSFEAAAIWSGTSQPWRIVPFAANFLRSRAPDAPADLLRCAQPQFR